MAPSTDTHSSMVACPPLEDIAAFLDGTLSPEERARITEHLARCERCYEIFAGAVHFQEEEKASAAEGTGGRGVLPFPVKGEHHDPGPLPEPGAWVERGSRRSSRWLLPLAASLVLAAGLGFFAWQFFAVPSTMDVADLVAPLQEKPGLAGSLYRGKTYRGVDEAGDLLPDEHAFLAGVYLIDLQLSVQARVPEKASEALHSLGSEVAETELSEGVGERYQKESARLESAEGLGEFAGRLPDEEKKLRELLSPYEPFFSFGLWAEAGRLAAATQTGAFFEKRDNRRFLSHLQKALPDQLAPELRQPVQDDLKAIEHTWNQGDLSPQSFSALAKSFQSIIQRIDDYKEELPGDS